MNLILQPSEELLEAIKKLKIENENKIEEIYREFYKFYFEKHGGSYPRLFRRVALPPVDTVDIDNVKLLKFKFPKEYKDWLNNETMYVPKSRKRVIEYLDSIIPVVETSLRINAALIISPDDAKILENLYPK